MPWPTRAERVPGPLGDPRDEDRAPPVAPLGVAHRGAVAADRRPVVRPRRDLVHAGSRLGEREGDHLVLHGPGARRGGRGEEQEQDGQREEPHHASRRLASRDAADRLDRPRVLLLADPDVRLLGHRPRRDAERLHRRRVRQPAGTTSSASTSTRPRPARRERVRVGRRLGDLDDREHPLPPRRVVDEAVAAAPSAAGAGSRCGAGRASPRSSSSHASGSDHLAWPSALSQCVTPGAARAATASRGTRSPRATR